jgi:hypothetical protein
LKASVVIAPKAPFLKDASSHPARRDAPPRLRPPACLSAFFCRRWARKATRRRTNLCDRRCGAHVYLKFICAFTRTKRTVFVLSASAGAAAHIPPSIRDRNLTNLLLQGAISCRNSMVDRPQPPKERLRHHLQLSPGG